MLFRFVGVFTGRLSSRDEQWLSTQRCHPYAAFGLLLLVVLYLVIVGG